MRTTLDLRRQERKAASDESRPEANGRVLIAADCKVDPVFISTLEERLGVKADLLFIDTTGKTRARALLRHASYLLLAVRALRRRHAYQHIVFWQQFAGLYYGLVSSVVSPRHRGPGTMVLHIIYKRRGGLLGRTYRRLFASFLRSNAIGTYVCHSSRERELYVEEFGSDLQERIRFIKYGSGMPAPPLPREEGEAFFSGGTSNRDYATLLSAFGGRREKLTVLCFPNDVHGLPVPANVNVVHDIYGEEFLERMKASLAVIVPLDRPSISSGHLVLLDAMRHGKAVIATKGECTADLVDESCALLVAPHSVEDMASAIEEMALDREKRSRLAGNGRLRYESEFTVRKYGERIADTLIGSHRAARPS